jgi:energy-converting hydrogenase Eha subunit A
LKLPLWLAAVLPATLIGHGIAYAVAGRSASDAAHAWVMPALDCSLALLLALCCSLIVGALLKAGVLAHTATERSALQLWPRLAIAQLAVFVTMEQVDGSGATLLGCFVQLLAALCVAYVLAVFVRLLDRCAAGSRAAFRYFERQVKTAAVFVSREPQCVAVQLAVSAGAARFQRPPPVR